MRTKLFLLLNVAALAVAFLAGCTPRRAVRIDYGPRLDAIESRLVDLEAKLDSLVAEVHKANTNDEILNENMERLYSEVDELRQKMGLPLSKPRRILVK